MKIAFVHEFLTQLGGGERVLDAFLDLWPTGPIHTLVHHPEKIGHHYDTFEVKTSFIQKLWAPPPAGYKWWLTLYPTAIESFKFDDYDVVLSDSSAFAKGVKTGPSTLHVCYIHTPTRYLWSVTKDYLKDAPIPNLIRPIMPPFMAYLRQWDYRAGQRPDYIIANSKVVADRIQKFYHRQADEIIFPPVDTKRFVPAAKVGDYWFLICRQEPYKRTDLAIAAANKLGLKLVIAGGGTNVEALKQMAGPTIEFVGRVSEQELADYYAHAIGMIFPPEEDAGITPLESMAAGRPVLAFGKGGALESVVPGVTGEFFAEQTVESLTAALSQFKPEQYDTAKIRAHAQSFSVPEFQKKIEAAIAKAQVQGKRDERRV